jgi:hypothetical protein
MIDHHVHCAGWIDADTDRRIHPGCRGPVNRLADALQATMQRRLHETTSMWVDKSRVFPANVRDFVLKTASWCRPVAL